MLMGLVAFTLCLGLSIREEFMTQKRILIVDDEENFRHMLSVILVKEGYEVEIAFEAMKTGAYDYISKPFKPDEIILTLRKAEEREQLRRENQLLRKEVAKEYSFENIVSKNEKMKKLFDVIKKVAIYKSTVLITGESGTGKELVARALHYNSDRSQNPFMPVNCGAIPENLLESELFGHAKGAFTEEFTFQ